MNPNDDLLVSIFPEEKEKKPRLETKLQVGQKVTSDLPYVPSYKVEVNSTTTSVKRFENAYHPDAEVDYWCPQILPESFDSLTVVIPAFNEMPHDLCSTLRSIHHQLPKLAALKQCVHVLVILDGWFKASKEMQDFMETLFPSNNPQKKWSYDIGEIVGGKERECVDTFVIQNVDSDTQTIVPVVFGTDKSTGKEMSLRLSLLVKRDNRRKHNSHAWFLNSFAPYYKSKFIFLTDCGTLYDPDCMAYLVEYLLTHEDCVSVTGRQRVMTFHQQTHRMVVLPGCSEPHEVEKKTESWFSFEGLYRRAQCFDYEASTACFNGAFAMFGMLPVIPGPCGMSRFSILYSEEKRKERQLQLINATLLSLKQKLKDCLSRHALNELRQSVAKSAFERYESCSLKLVSHLNTLALPTPLPVPLTQPSLKQKPFPIVPGTTLNKDKADIKERYHNFRLNLRDKMKKKEQKEKEEKEYQNIVYDDVKAMEMSSKKMETQPLLSISPQQVKKTISLIEHAFQNEETNANIEQLKHYLKMWQNKCVQWWSLLQEHERLFQSLNSVLVKAISVLEEKQKTPLRYQLVLELHKLNESEQKLNARLDDLPLAVEEYENQVKLALSLLLRNDSLRDELQTPNEFMMPSKPTKTQDVRKLLEEQWKRSNYRNKQRVIDRRNLLEEQKLELMQEKRSFEYKNPMDPIDFYLIEVNQNPDETDMLTATLLLAEDRVLSTAAVLLADKAVYTAYDPRSVFYFEAETNENTFLPQRRRWINGSSASYVWLLMHCSLLWNSKAALRTKIGIPILVFFQLVMFSIVAIAPAIFAIGFRSALNATFQGASQFYLDLMLFAYTGLYYLFVQIHVSTEKECRVVPWLFRIVTVVNALVVPWMIIFLVQTVLSESIKTDSSSVITLLAVLNFVLPFALSLLHGFSQMLFMFWSISHFLIFLPTLVATIGAYALSRTWDLTWGNRPSEHLGSMEKSKAFNDSEIIKAKQKDVSRFLLWLTVILNFILLLVVMTVDQSLVLVLGLSVAVFGWALIQMILSGVYLLWNLIVNRCIKHYILKRMCRCSRLTLTGYFLSVSDLSKEHWQRFCKDEGLTDEEAENFWLLPDSDVQDLCFG